MGSAGQATSPVEVEVVCQADTMEKTGSQCTTAATSDSSTTSSGPGAGGGRNRGRGGAAGLGTRSTAELGRAPRREKRRTRRGGWSGTLGYGGTGPGPLGTQPSCTPNVGGGRRDEGPLAATRKDAAAGSLGRTTPGVRLLEAVGRLPPALVCGGDWLQMEEMEGQRSRVLADFGGPSGL